MLSPARTSALTDLVLREQLGHLGETAYVLRNFKVNLESDLFIPIRFHKPASTGCDLPGWILSQPGNNEPSREKQPASCYVQHLEDPRALDRNRRSPESALSGLLVEAQACGNESPELITLCRTFEQIEAAMEEAIETVYVDFEDIRLYQQAVERIGDRARGLSATPRIQKSGEQGFFRLIENAQPYGVLIRNLGSISFFRHKRFRLHGDFSLNVANPLTADFFVQRGLDQLTHFL